MKHIIPIIFFSFLLFTSLSHAQYQCQWTTFSTAGGNLTSTNYLAGTTLGQTAIGVLTSSNILAKIGFWYPLPTVGITEQKDEEISQTQELVTTLYNARPNPFKTQTAIRYSIPLPTRVSLLIYDISGRLVRTLINEEQTSGIYNVNWDMKNDRSQTVAAGVYFYKFQTPYYSATRKLLLVE